MSKRKVSTDALETLGTIIDETQKRDAIHLAVEPVIAAEKLYPGQSITVKDGKAYSNSVNPLGIVDPFLNGPVFPEQRFWFIMMPRMVHSLRHVWTHPSFPDEPEVAVSTNPKVDEKKDSEAYIQNVAYDAGLEYDELMEAADHFIKTGTYLCEGGRWEGMWVDDEFWDHYEKVTGIEVNENDRGGLFSCSC